MTIRDLKAKLSDMDDNYTITLESSDGSHMDITGTRLQGDQFTLMTDSSS